MSQLFEQFCLVLKEFGEASKCLLEFDDDFACTFPVDGQYAVNLHYLPDSDSIILWTLLGELPDDDAAADRAEYLLRVQNFGLQTRGFSLGMEADERQVVVQDLRNAEEIYDADHLAAWIEDMLEVTKDIRDAMVRMYPYDSDLESLDDDEDATRNLPKIKFGNENN